ncbi:MAG TPA: glucosidase, partial [bacterium]|nr:glucosidase [bacterium]
MADLSVEHKRLAEAREKKTPWRLWGPYLSERQWGTVREDYSRDGNAWNYFPHDHARSRAYKWGEDGIAGISDEKQRLCFALAFWNEKDPILKERLFGLTNSEGNHGEDVKEYYFYLDSTPTHSWMQMLYKYPQEAYPYDLIVKTNRSRGPKEWEYELLDTKVFDKDRYFDIFVEFAKAGTEDLYVRIRAVNRGNAEAPLHILPHLWFRNTWWMDENIKKPVIAAAGKCGVTATHPELGLYSMAGDEPKEIIFTENETNTERLFHKTNATPHVKDAFHRYLINGETGAVNPARKGTKAAFHYVKTVPAGKEWSVTLRLSATGTARRAPAFSGSAAERVLDLRKREADAFYDAIMPRAVTEDDRRILRQGFSGMLWSKQTYIYEVDQWLKDHGLDPQTDAHKGMRNSEWFHMANCDVISMPDKWEYPWFAAWDLAFHTIALSFVDPDFANQQLDLMLRERYLHPSGQIPAYEWNFGDVNPPVHAWATIFNYRFNNLLLMKEQAVPMLKRNFHKLLLNFTWWVNRKDPDGKNVFEGGFLGMDNIGVFDRSSPLPTGGRLEQADGTAWMSLFAQNMLEISLLLAEHDPVYEDFAIKFYDHFVRIAASMDRPGERIDEMWDEKDGFFYDVLRLPDGRAHRLKIRSMVGLLPLCAVTVFSEEDLEKLPAFAARIDEISRRYPEMVKNIYSMRRRGVNGHRMLS